MNYGSSRTIRNDRLAAEKGFSLTEFLLSVSILLVVTSGAFTMLAETQRTAGFHSEIQAVANTTRIALATVERHLRQTGNDPMNIGLWPLSVPAPDRIHLQSDLKGSLGSGNPNKGDPDGDIDDADENIVIRFNASSNAIEIVPVSGPPRIIANYISAFSAALYDADGNPTSSGSAARKIIISVTGCSRVPDPRTRQLFSLMMSSTINLYS